MRPRNSSLVPTPTMQGQLPVASGTQTGPRRGVRLEDLRASPEEPGRPDAATVMPSEPVSLPSLLLESPHLGSGSGGHPLEGGVSFL